MDYRGYKVKETTAIGAFDVPRKMLVWGERGKCKDDSPKVDTVSARVRLDAGVFALTTTGAFYEHCADIPLEAQLDDANSEIAKLKKALDAVHSGKVIIYRHHDRHTEDHVEVYPYSEENFEKLKLKCQGDLVYEFRLCFQCARKSRALVVRYFRLRMGLGRPLLVLADGQGHSQDFGGK